MGFERIVTTELAYQFGEVYIEIKFLQNFSEEYAALNGLDVGHRCGYVTVSRDNGDGTFRSFSKAEDSYEVHGGVTYVREQGGMATIGFDCAHVGDSLETCTLEYVRQECESLARQIMGGK